MNAHQRRQHRRHTALGQLRANLAAAKHSGVTSAVWLARIELMAYLDERG